MATDATVVSIFALGENGATGQRVGTGVLLAPDLVVVHPPLAGQLSGDGDGPGLRVGIAAADGLVEVLDVAQTHVSPRDDAVALELTGPSTAPTATLPRTTKTFRKTLGGLLEGTTPPGSPVPDPPVPGPLPPPPDPRHSRPVWCPIWPKGPGCRRP